MMPNEITESPKGRSRWSSGLQRFKPKQPEKFFAEVVFLVTDLVVFALVVWLTKVGWLWGWAIAHTAALVAATLTSWWLDKRKHPLSGVDFNMDK